MAFVRNYIDAQFKNEEVEAIQIGSFQTAAKISQSVTKSQDAPIAVVEDGTFIGDHLLVKPISIVIEGQISNVFAIPSVAVRELIDAQRNIGNISQYAPARSQSQLQKINSLAITALDTANLVDSIIEDTMRAGDYVGFTGNEGKTNIEKFLDYMDAVTNGDTLIPISAPFRTYNNMAVTSFVAEETSETTSLDFKIELQEVRIANSVFVLTAAPKPSKSTGGQTESKADKGAQEGDKLTADDSIVKNLVASGKKVFGAIF